MKAQDVMTSNPACCNPSSTVQEAALLMVDNDCGQIPVVDDSGALVGVVTDRDIACRCVAKGNSSDQRVEEVMTSSPVTVTADAADIARSAAEKETGDLVREVSEASSEPASAGCC